MDVGEKVSEPCEEEAADDGEMSLAWCLGDDDNPLVIELSFDEWDLRAAAGREAKESREDEDKDWDGREC